MTARGIYTKIAVGYLCISHKNQPQKFFVDCIIRPTSYVRPNIAYDLRYAGDRKGLPYGMHFVHRH